MSFTIGHLISIIIVLAFVVGLSYPAQAQDSIPEPQGIRFAPSLRSVQLDGTLFFFSFAYSASADVDILQLRSQSRSLLGSSLGIRAGVEQFANSGPGGNTGGSPHLDYNLLLRLTVAGEALRCDAYVGFVRRSGEPTQFYPSRNLMKYGGELRWKVAPNVFGLLLKAHRAEREGTFGLGLYFGWDQ